MRIVHVIDYFQPKLGYQETYLATFQAKEGHNVSVLTSDRYSPILYPSTRGILGDRIRHAGLFIEEGVRVYRLPVTLELLGKVWIRGLRRKLVELDPELIVVHNVFSLASVQVASIKRLLPRATLIVDDHMLKETAKKWTRVFYAVFALFFGRKIVSSADGLIAITEDVRESMAMIYRIPLERIRIIPLGCDTALFHRDQMARNKLRKRYRISEDDVAFIYTGRLLPGRGILTLVQAATSLRKKWPSVKLIIVGSGTADYVRSIMKMIGASHFQNNTVVIPMVPHRDLYRLYSTADIGVWPMHVSIAIIEAMACALPVIVGDDSGLYRGVPNETHLLCRPGEPLDLEKKMELLLDPEFRERIGKNARAFAEQVDWSTIARRFTSLKTK